MSPWRCLPGLAGADRQGPGIPGQKHLQAAVDERRAAWENANEELLTRVAACRQTLMEEEARLRSSGGNLGTARYGLAAGGNSSGAICMGGYVEDSPHYSALTEEYNGTAWSSGGNLGTAREGPAGGGSATEAVCFGGFSGSPLANTEIYDGSAWSSSDNMSTARYYLAGGGAPDGAIGMGGTTGSYSTVTETFTDALPVPRTMVIWI